MPRKSRAIQRSFASRYTDQWRETSRLTRALTGGRCCYPGCKAKAKTTHHATVQKPWVPLVNIFGLCDKHHGVDPVTHKKLPLAKLHPDAAHHPDNWYQGSYKKKYKDACNTPEYIARLRFGASLAQ